MYTHTHTSKIMCTIISIVIRSSVCALNFMLPACRQNFVEVARSTYIQCRTGLLEELSSIIFLKRNTNLGSGPSILTATCIITPGYTSLLLISFHYHYSVHTASTEHQRIFPTSTEAQNEAENSPEFSIEANEYVDNR
jgi:hypothetical protein